MTTFMYLEFEPWEQDNPFKRRCMFAAKHLVEEMEDEREVGQKMMEW